MTGVLALTYACCFSKPPFAMAMSCSTYGVEIQRGLICVQSSSTEISNMTTKVELVYLLMKGLRQVLPRVSASHYVDVQVRLVLVA